MNNIIIGFGLVLIFVLFSLPMANVGKLKEITMGMISVLSKKIKKQKRMMKFNFKKSIKQSREVKLTNHSIYAETVTKVKPSFSSIEYSSDTLQGWKCIEI